MIIELNRLIPVPLIGIPHMESEIWDSDSVVFNTGEKISIVAGSGKGKTSLLSCMYGIRKDYNGEIRIGGKPAISLSSREWSELRKKKLSYIFQGLELFDELTARENIHLKNRISGYKSSWAISSLADSLGIGPFLDKPAGKLSFGQRQRVAIIRALCQEMEFLFADEIFSHLDHKTAALAFEIISDELNQQGAGLIMTSLDELDGFPFDRLIRL